jgi:hypothetical protein
MSEGKTTINHKEIQKWVEARGGFPARVKRTGRGGDTGILRIDYPGFSGEETLEHISWPEWFDAFDANNLAFVYQDRVRTGATSRFSKLVSREGKAATPHRGVAAKRTAKTRAQQSSSNGRTTTKSPRALAARTSKRPTAKKKAAGKTAAPKRSSTKRAAAKRSTTSKRKTSGRAKRK